MINHTEIILAAISATTFMTLFSYLIAWMFSQPFQEPLLLAVLLNNFHFANNITNRILGWILHYLLGFAFVLGFEFILNIGWAGLTADAALVYGSFIGVLGILGWNIMFEFSDRKPSMDYIGYYMQLFIAHIIFAFTIIGAYEIF